MSALVKFEQRADNWTVKNMSLEASFVLNLDAVCAAIFDSDGLKIHMNGGMVITVNKEAAANVYGLLNANSKYAGLLKEIPK